MTQRLNLAEFECLLRDWKPRRRIDCIHVHHTWLPRIADFRGQATIEAIRRYHMQDKGWSDIAQHLTIAPDGGLWTGRPLDMPPASVLGFNGTSARGPFMIEMVGDFDKGRDKLEGAQWQAVLAVIVLVLRQFGLDEKAVRFHREYPGVAKTCPGDGLDLGDFRRAVETLLQSGAVLPLQRKATQSPLLEVRGWLEAPRAQDDTDETDPWYEPPYAEVPEEPDALYKQQVYAELMARGELAPLSREAARGSGLDVRPLLPHVINLSKGVLSEEGLIASAWGGTRTPVANLDEMMGVHIPRYIQMQLAKGQQPRILFYAHGGLVDEESALKYAKAMLPWWLAHGIFPIFIIWESGLLELWRRKSRGLQAPWPDSTRGLGDWISEFWDDSLGAVTRLAATATWTRCKNDATNASLDVIPALDGRPGGLYVFAKKFGQKFREWQGLIEASNAQRRLRAQPSLTLELHAIGHSTGPIVLSTFLPLLQAQDGLPPIRTLSYLAPAIRVDTFKKDVLPCLVKSNPPAIESLRIYTMTDAAEREDSVAYIYRKSLLYYVKLACEGNDTPAILGLARDLFDDLALVAQFGLKPGALSHRNGALGVEFSPLRSAPRQNPRTRSLEHGYFDNDAATMFSVLARVQGHPENYYDHAGLSEPEQQFPPEERFRGLRSLDGSRNVVVEGDDNRCYCQCTCQCACESAPAGLADRFDDDDPSVAELEVAAQPAKVQPHRNGRRTAVCIGIDAYTHNPLQGCVADSDLWAQTLKQLGFQIITLRDQQATRQAVLDALKELVSTAKPGDELVFQYAGHGTQIADASHQADEKFDQAFVPFDYEQGNLLIDDDFDAIVATKPASVSLTLFMDCCHSGSNSRFAAAGRPRAGTDERVRFLQLPAQVVAKYQEQRQHMSLVASPSSTRGGQSSARPGVAHFAACLDSEYAWESNGHGDFTRIANQLLLNAYGGRMSNRQFIKAVVAQFGAQPRQHPLLWQPSAAVAARSLLGGPV